jgi:hypothetical protein
MKNKFALLAIGLTLGFSACKPDDPEPDNNNNNGDGTVKVTMKFDSQFSGSAVDWSKFYLTGSNDTIMFDKVKYILSNFIFEKENGDLFQLPASYAYLSLKDGRDSVILGGIPKGKYKSVRFTVGLDSQVNHSDPTKWALDHPLSPSLNEMHWGWAGGYIFNVLEGYYKKDGSNAGFSFHVALDKNTRTHVFNVNFEVSGNGRFVFNSNLDKYFDNIINYSIKTDGAFSHSADVDPVMDKFMQNMNGIFEFVSYK